MMMFHGKMMMGMMKQRFLTGMCIVIVMLCSTSTVVLGQQILVNDFELSIEQGNYGSPTKIVFADDGTLWATDKHGIVEVADPDDYDNPREVLDITDQVCENGERGLESIALHPDFGVNNPYIWLFYSHNKHGGCAESANSGPVMRLSRFTCLTTGTHRCDPDSEEVYLETGSFPFDHHNGGDVAFGKDGYIYATIGDGGESDWAQDRYSLFGTVIRLTQDNQVPDSNPYTGSNSVRCGTRGGYTGDVDKRCSEIFAYGIRNPFRLIMNPNVGRTEFYILDVGASMWEEISVGGDGYKGANYGWPIREGPCKKGRRCDDDCNPSTNYVEPIHYYGHDSSGDGAVTAGAFVPNSGKWPSSYEGNFVYGDYVFGQLFLMDPKNSGENRNTCPVRSAYEPEQLIDFDRSYPVSIAFNPLDGHLYFAIRGFGGRLNRIRYVGNNPATGNGGQNNGGGGGGVGQGQGNNTNVDTPVGSVNRGPQPIIRVSTTGGPPGTVVTFDATQSTDPDDDPNLLFEWDFDGDGTIDSTDAIATHVYNTPGVYEVMLKVRDGKGGRNSAYTEIGIGDYPAAEILVPQEGVEFFVGEVFILTGSATGTNIGNEDNSMEWEVRQHHNTHYHPFLDLTQGNEIQLQPAPSPEDLLASTNSYLEIILTVTDDAGLKTTVTRNVMPQKREVEIDSVPPGMTIRVDGTDLTTPETIISWVNHPLRVEAMEGDGTFVSWSNNGAKQHEMTIPQSIQEKLQLVALYTPVAGTAMPGFLPAGTPTDETPAPAPIPTAAPALPGLNADKPSSTTVTPAPTRIASPGQASGGDDPSNHLVGKIGGMMILLLASLFVLV